ncbi:hypothetical protein [Rhizobium sp. BK399]|uniref:hypothetical protein n=1 Tax=Rhizobium sp. BK399 TaxID=2587063 RepID=UPI00160C1AC4|nr:hypothetical protein [Rhizobium sp. BK399]MBB3540803.1 hypothetical protein [Rhizobium sp. BK399]
MRNNDVEWEFTAPEMSVRRRAEEAGFLLVRNPNTEAGGYLLANDENCVVFGSDYSVDLDEILVWLTS